jgi:hypothetical protein
MPQNPIWHTLLREAAYDALATRLRQPVCVVLAIWPCLTPVCALFKERRAA